jgi:hypothetical protein
MRYYEASSMIASSPEAVWAGLTDGAAWPTRLRFGGGMPLGLFRGVRTFEMSSDGTGGTAFRVREGYTGPLVGLIRRSMPDLGRSFDRFAQGLKRRAETGR